MPREVVWTEQTSGAEHHVARSLAGAALDAARDAVIVTDADGVVVLWNRSAAELYGWTADEAVGRNITDLTVAPDAGIPASVIMTSVASGDPWSGEYLVRRKDGSVFVAHVTDVPLLDEDGAVRGIAGFSHRLRNRRPLPLERLELPDALHILESGLVRPEFPSLPDIRFSAAHLAADDGPGLGGDWYDAFIVPDGSVVLAVGDVTGHGLDAARFMAKMRHATRAYAITMPFPEVLPALDRFLRHFASGDFCATVQLAIFDPRDDSLTFADAGHPPALVIGPTGQAVVVDVAVNPLLGAPGQRAAFETTTIPWPRGGAVVMYTDGLVERRGEPLDDGIARLASALESAASAGADAVRDAAINGCLSGAPRRDDACILVVSRS